MFIKNLYYKFMLMANLIFPLEKQNLVEMPVVENFNNLERKKIK